MHMTAMEILEVFLAAFAASFGVIAIFIAPLYAANLFRKRLKAKLRRRRRNAVIRESRPFAPQFFGRRFPDAV